MILLESKCTGHQGKKSIIKSIHACNTLQRGNQRPTTILMGKPLCLRSDTINHILFRIPTTILED